MNELKIQEIKKALHKVCKSETFASSGRNIRLLKFLVQKTLNGEFVKEQIVGFELFKKDYNPDEKNSKVRVYMFNLRQKLNEYYTKEGSTDNIKFELKKGQYALEFIEQKNINNQKKHWWKIGIPAVFIFASVVLYIGYNQKTQNLWASFFKSPNETICFISDHFIVSKRINDKLIFSHILQVNDESDLNDYQTQTSDTMYKAQPFSYISKMGPISVHALTRHFMKNNADFTVELESDFKYDDLKNKNLIFIGQFSSLHQSETLFLDNSKVFINNTGSFLYCTKNDTINYYNKVRTDKSLDYAMVSYRKMDNGNSVLFFSSNHDIGVLATVKNFTDKIWLNNFYSNFPEDAESFNALFEVTGFKRTDLDCKLEQIEFVE